MQNNYLTDYLHITVNGENLTKHIIDNILKTLNESLANTNIAKNISIELENEDFTELDFNELLYSNKGDK
jgi:sensor c-di-GMP phosphodiesterase-like protein